MAKSILQTATLAAALLLSACTARPAAQELRLFTWSEYFSQELIEEFSRETGLSVKVDYFSSNEEMLTKLQLTADGPGYDIILPSDYMVRLMIELGLLRNIDPARLPVLKDFEPAGLDPPYDRGLRHSIPLSVGLTGLAWNTKLLPHLPAHLTWKEFFENPALKGKVTLLDDTREVLQVALLARGYRLESAKESEVREAFQYLRQHKGQFRGFTSETRSVIEADECALCMAYSGDVRAVAKHKPEIRFVLPKDGATIWTDNFAIPKNARNPEGAYLFINKMLSPNGARDFTARTGYRTLVQRARALLPPEAAKDPVIYPPAASTPPLHYLVSHPALALLIDREWAQLRAE